MIVYDVSDVAEKSLESKVINELVVKYSDDFVPALLKRNSSLQKQWHRESNFDNAYVEELITQTNIFIKESPNSYPFGFLSVKLDHQKDSHYVTTCIIDAKYRGKGYVRFLYDYLFLLAGDKPVITRTWSTNIGSIKSLEANGFIESERIENDRGNGISTIYFIRPC